MNDREKLLDEAVDLMRALSRDRPLDESGQCWYCGRACKPDCPYTEARKFLARDEIAGRSAG